MIFNHKKYIEANEIEDVHEIKILDKQGFPINLFVAKNKEELVSLPRAPYSGWIFQNRFSIEPAMKRLTQLSHQLGIKQIVIKQAPDFYNTYPHELNLELLKYGFSHSNEINHHIDLSQWREMFSSMQMRRVKKGEKLGLQFDFQNGDKVDQTSIYSFISHCRQQQGLDVNVSLSTFQKLLNHLPSEFKVATIKDETGEIMACVVTITTLPNVLYSFLPAFDRQFSQISPLALLYHRLFEVLQEANFQWVDLGISSINSTPQTGLISFKESLGGIKTERKTYTLAVNSDPEQV